MIPSSLLERLAADPRIPPSSRSALERTLLLEGRLGPRRKEFLSRPTPNRSPWPLATVIVYDCQETETLPGTFVPPGTAIGSAKRAFDYTSRLLQFFALCFNRNSIDGAGISLQSSVHFSRSFSNAHWSNELGEMIYGDGDGLMLLDFTFSPEFIGHEITHGLTQYTSKLQYEDEPGALNESISDVFGSVFVQWLFNQDVNSAHWQIGPNIVGPVAKKMGWTCVRDLADPGSPRSMTKQPSNYKDYIPGGDPHDNSGIPNHAFYVASKSLGGHSWHHLGEVWYSTITDPRAHAKMGFAEFAEFNVENALIRFPLRPEVAISVAEAWAKVGVK